MFPAEGSSATGSATAALLPPSSGWCTAGTGLGNYSSRIAAPAGPRSFAGGASCNPVLPWGRMSFWGSTADTSLPSSTPPVGSGDGPPWSGRPTTYLRSLQQSPPTPGFQRRADTPPRRPFSGGPAPSADPGSPRSNPPKRPDRWRKVWSLCAPVNQRFSRRRLRAYLRRQMTRREAEQRRAEERFFRRLPPQPLDGRFPPFSGPSPAQLLRGDKKPPLEMYPCCAAPPRKLRNGSAEEIQRRHRAEWELYRTSCLGEGTTPEPYAK